MQTRSFPRNGATINFIAENYTKSLKSGYSDPTKNSDLSAAHGDVVLFEYAEQNPPFLNNKGMASRLCLFSSAEDDCAAAENVFCKAVRLSADKPPPFFGGGKDQKDVLAVENNLFRAPAVRHAAWPTDFLAVKASDDRWVLRPTGPVYLVGQQQPKRLVFAPKSPSATELLRDRVVSIILRCFQV